jgi:hypothetical protein
MGSGRLEGDSEDIYVRYMGEVQGNVTLGVSLLNGAKITTSDAQDNYYDKEDEQEIAIPYPNLYVQLSSPLTIAGGNVFDYTLQYGNQSRMCAEKPSLLITLPSEGGTSIVKLKTMTPSQGERVYSFPCGSMPTLFNRDMPLTGGRTS